MTSLSASPPSPDVRPFSPESKTCFFRLKTALKMTRVTSARVRLFAALKRCDCQSEKPSTAVETLRLVH